MQSGTGGADEPAASILTNIPTDGVALEAALGIPDTPTGVVLFAHGSGSGRLSPRNNFVAQALHRAGLATLLLDLLTPAEERSRSARFDIDLLARRLAGAALWLRDSHATAALPIGLFGASTGAAAALRVAAARRELVGAVVSRGGRPDMAGAHLLHLVHAPTLLIVGALDDEVLALNRAAFADLRCRKQLEVVSGATHLFEEPGALEQVAQLAQHWFTHQLRQALPE